MGFWKRQFDPEFADKSPAAGPFDFFAGIGLTIFCFVFDPIVFRGSAGLGNWSTFAYTQVLMAIPLLAYTLLRSPSSPWIAGALTGCGLTAFAIALCLLPYSVFGLLILIGILGFAPFLTAFAFFRNAALVWKRRQPQEPVNLAWICAATGLVVMLGIPALTQGGVKYLITSSIDRVARGEASPWTVRVLRETVPLADFDRIVWAYDRERDPVRQEILKRAYKELTGQEVVWRLGRIKF